MSKTKLLLDVVQDMRCLADSLKAMADAIVGNMGETDDEPDVGRPAEPAAEASMEMPKIDLVTLRARVAEYSTPENRPKIKTVLTNFGVKKLTELKEDQYAGVLAEVEKACRV